MRSLFAEDQRATGRTPPSAAPATATPAAASSAGSNGSRRTIWWILGLVAAAATAAGAVWYWRQRPRWSAVFAYERLRATLANAGLPIRDSLAPLALAELASERLPDAAEPTTRLVAGYLREAYADEPLAEDELPALRTDLEAVERAIRLDRKARRRRGRRAA
jgi:hypothetical protein